MAAFLESSSWPGPLPCESQGSSWLTPAIYTTHNTHVCAHMCACTCTHRHTHPTSHVLSILQTVQIDENCLLQGWMLGRSWTSGVGGPGCQFLSYGLRPMPSPPPSLSFFICTMGSTVIPRPHVPGLFRAFHEATSAKRLAQHPLCVARAP